MDNTYQRTDSGCLSPYVLYGIIAFFPPLILTLIINGIWFPDWDWPFTWLVVHNIATFFVYGYDKKIAPTNAMRVPELILLLEVLLGALVGALIARSLFRHKTQKISFRVGFWIAGIIAIGWIAWYYILVFRW